MKRTRETIEQELQALQHQLYLVEEEYAYHPDTLEEKRQASEAATRTLLGPTLAHLLCSTGRLIAFSQSIEEETDTGCNDQVHKSYTTYEDTWTCAFGLDGKNFLFTSTRWINLEEDEGWSQPEGLHLPLAKFRGAIPMKEAWKHFLASNDGNVAHALASLAWYCFCKCDSDYTSLVERFPDAESELSE